METKQKFEYHCDKETFLKLKEVNKHLTAAKHAYAKWYRAKIKTVYKKPIPDLGEYGMFIEEHTRLDRPYGIEMGPAPDYKTRSNKSAWMKTEEDTRAYTYFDPQYFQHRWLKSKVKRDGEESLNDVQKKMYKDIWCCLHTHYIDEAYQICRKPISADNILPPKLSKSMINALYEKIKN